MRTRKDYTYMKYEFEVLGRKACDIAAEHSVSLAALEKKIYSEGWGSDNRCMERLVRISDKLESSIESTLEESVDIKSFKELTAAIKDAVAIRRNLFRLPTQAEEFEQKISAKKLEAGEESEKKLTVEFSVPDYCE